MKPMQVTKNSGPEMKPDLGKLYKPVGIQAITAATTCKKAVLHKPAVLKKNH